MDVVARNGGYLNACRHRCMQCKKLEEDDETGGSGYDLGDRLGGYHKLLKPMLKSL